MASFNGGAYLAEQLDSLVAQTHADWTLLVSDDGSTDNSRQILSAYAKRDARIRVLGHERRGVGSALQNFAQLMVAAVDQGAEYILSCDQDDRWEADKIGKVIAVLKDVEGAEQKPALVHHDLAVVDQHLNLMNSSFMKMMNIQPGDEHNPQRLISRNEVTGCALACNRALLKLALPVPDSAIMHDWWLALFAGFFGRLHFMPEALVKYRQHDSNVIGAKSFWHNLNPLNNWLKVWQRGNAEFLDTVVQANAFQNAISDRGLKIETPVLDLYAQLPAASRLQRLKNLRACQLWRSHWLLNATLILRMLLLPRTSA